MMFISKAARDQPRQADQEAGDQAQVHRGQQHVVAPVMDV
jgi:hypothetical protein